MASFCENSDTIPAENENYKLKQYWDERFTKEEKYEWLATYADLKEVVNTHANKTDRILLVGCGNSMLGPDMIKDGFTDLVSSDFSATVIESMKSRFSGFEWVVSDVKDLKEFGDNSFDVVFDKATMDALICDEGSCWDPNETTVDDVNSMCQAAIRVLKPKGKFLQLTFQDPYFRKRYIFNESLAWKQTNYTKIDSGLGYHFFVAEKL